MTTPAMLDCWFLTGPTAAGKTGVGIELALRLGAEIISLDSMALYRGMEIGTAKPSGEQRHMVPHHLIDVVEGHEEFSLARYVEEATRCIHQIKGRGREVLFVGGTPLYLKGLLRGIFQGPEADWELRKKLRQEILSHGTEALHGRLAQIDPAAAERIHPNDARRIIRALEVFEKTGQPISELQQQFDRPPVPACCRVFVLDWPREELYRRINRRVEAMFEQGLVEEVRGLLARPDPLSRTARKAVGYREVIEHLAGEHDLTETMELVGRHTRQLAKRQGTWFRSLAECRFVPMDGQFDASDVAEGIYDEGTG